MNLVINKKVFLIVFLFVGLLLGVGLMWLYDSYKEDLFDLVGLKEKNNTIEREFDIPYFANNTWDFSFGESGQWGFYIFQPKIVGYSSSDGLNYADIEYKYGDEEESSEFSAKLILSREKDVEAVLGDLEADILTDLIGETIALQKSFNNNFATAQQDSVLSLDSFKETFPVGSRIALAIPLHYPDSSSRNEEICAVGNNLCLYAQVWDLFSSDFEALQNGEDIHSREFKILPFSMSTDLYKWSDEGRDEKEIRNTPAD
jgi:hypothetical protein